MKLPTYPNLEGLIQLARQDGVDVRPTLVRVLTDMYVQKRGHTRDEERRFTELALWLLSTVDSATRAAVASKLAFYPEAPRAVVRRLGADEFEIAETVLRNSPCLTGEDLLAITIERGARHADAIEARESAVATATRSIATPDAGNSASVDGAPIAADGPRAGPILPDAQTPGAGENRSLGNPVAPRGREHITIGEHFLNSNGEERRAILMDLADVSLGPAAQVSQVEQQAIVRLEAAALGERPDDFSRELEQLLRVSSSRAQQIVGDKRGEPVVIAARAVGMPTDVLLRVLLFLNPAIGQSVERVFDLMDLYYRVTPGAALTLVASWRDAQPAEKRSARYQSLHWDDDARTRRPGLDHAWRQVPQRPDDRALPGRGDESVNGERRQRST